MSEIAASNAFTESGASDEELRALDEIFADAGVNVRFRADMLHLSGGALPWVVYVTAPVVPFLWAFSKKAGELAAEDSWRALKSLVGRIVDARDGRQDGTIKLTDDESGTMIELTSGLPDDAYRALFTVDWSKAAKGRMAWHPSQQCWVDLDGKAVPTRSQTAAPSTAPE